MACHRSGADPSPFRVKGLVAAKRWVYRWIPSVEVKSPKRLRETVLKELRAAGRKNRLPK